MIFGEFDKSVKWLDKLYPHPFNGWLLELVSDRPGGGSIYGIHHLRTDGTCSFLHLGVSLYRFSDDGIVKFSTFHVDPREPYDDNYEKNNSHYINKDGLVTSNHKEAVSSPRPNFRYVLIHDIVREFFDIPIGEFGFGVIYPRPNKTKTMFSLPEMPVVIGFHGLFYVEFASDGLSCVVIRGNKFVIIDL